MFSEATAFFASAANDGVVCIPASAFDILAVESFSWSLLVCGPTLLVTEVSACGYSLLQMAGDSFVLGVVNSVLLHGVAMARRRIFAMVISHSFSLQSVFLLESHRKKTLVSSSPWRRERG